MKKGVWIIAPLAGFYLSGCVSSDTVEQAINDFIDRYNESRAETTQEVIDSFSGPSPAPEPVKIPQTYEPFTPQPTTEPAPDPSGTTTVTVDTKLDGRLLASHCYQCHGTNGYSTNKWDGIAGEEMEEFYEDHPLMAAQARGYTQEEVRAIFSWLNTLKKHDDDRYDDDRYDDDRYDDDRYDDDRDDDDRDDDDRYDDDYHDDDRYEYDKD